MDYQAFCQSLNALIEGRNLHGEGAETAVNTIALGMGVSLARVRILWRGIYSEIFCLALCFLPRLEETEIGDLRR